MKLLVFLLFFLAISISSPLGAMPFPVKTNVAETSTITTVSAAPIEPAPITKKKHKAKKQRRTKQKPYAATWLLWSFALHFIGALLLFLAAIFALVAWGGGGVAAGLAILFIVLTIAAGILLLVFWILGLVQGFHNYRQYDYKQLRQTALWATLLAILALISTGLAFSAIIGATALGVFIYLSPIVILLGFTIALAVLAFRQIIRQEKKWSKEENNNSTTPQQ